MFTTKNLFELFEFLRTGVDNPNISPEIKQLALATKLQTQQFFQSTIDQISFSSNDVNKLRKLLIDWYSALKTYQNIAKNTSDAFSLPHFLIDSQCKSFGFNYSRGIGRKFDKVLFLYSLAELYKIKGTPKSIKSALEFFGVYDIQIFEWWLKKDKVLDRLYFESSYVDLGGAITPESIQTVRIPYHLMRLDPHWWYTDSKIYDLNETLPIRLPSITPYFSISANASLDKLNQVYSIISRQISDQYKKYVDLNLLDRTIFIDIYGKNLSLLELVLVISYIFNTWTERNIVTDSTAQYIYYTGQETDTDVIIEEYTNIVGKPNTRNEQKLRIQEFSNKFTNIQSSNFLQTADDVALKLDFVNSDLKEWADDQLLIETSIESVLSQLLKELDIYVRMNFGIYALSFQQMVLGTEAKELYDVINFFKPKRARLLSLNLLYAIDDRLFNSIVLDDNIIVNPNMVFNEYGRMFDFDLCGQFDIGLMQVHECMKPIIVKEKFLERIPRVSCRRMDFDMGDFFDRCPGITRTITHNIPNFDRIYDIGFIYDVLESPGGERIYDVGFIYDQENWFQPVTEDVCDCDMLRYIGIKNYPKEYILLQDKFKRSNIKLIFEDHTYHDFTYDIGLKYDQHRPCVKDSFIPVIHLLLKDIINTNERITQTNIKERRQEYIHLNDIEKYSTRLYLDDMYETLYGLSFEVFKDIQQQSVNLLENDNMYTLHDQIEIIVNDV